MRSGMKKKVLGSFYISLLSAMILIDSYNFIITVITIELISFMSDSDGVVFMLHWLKMTCGIMPIICYLCISIDLQCVKKLINYFQDQFNGFFKA